MRNKSGGWNKTKRRVLYSTRINHDMCNCINFLLLMKMKWPFFVTLSRGSPVQFKNYVNVFKLISIWTCCSLPNIFRINWQIKKGCNKVSRWNKFQLKSSIETKIKLKDKTSAKSGQIIFKTCYLLLHPIWKIIILLKKGTVISFDLTDTFSRNEWLAVGLFTTMTIN